MKIRQIKVRMFTRIGNLFPTLPKVELVNVVRKKDGVLVAEQVTRPTALVLIEKATKQRKAALIIA